MCVCVCVCFKRSPAIKLPVKFPVLDSSSKYLLNFLVSSLPFHGHSCPFRDVIVGLLLVKCSETIRLHLSGRKLQCRLSPVKILDMLLTYPCKIQFFEMIVLWIGVCVYYSSSWVKILALSFIILMIWGMLLNPKNT